jgi:5-methylcytosine-specific restriction endonuclease McrA
MPDASRKEYFAKYRADHREDLRIYGRAHYLKNREQVYAKHRAYDALYPEQKRALDRTRYMTNTEAEKARSRTYFAAHPEKVTEYNHARRARKLGAFVESVDRETVFLNDAGICQWQYCSEASPFVDPQNWHLDHIQPLSRGGEHSYQNAQVTHPVCNLRKGAKVG